MTLTESAGIARVFFKEENRELTSRFGAALRQHINQWNDPRSEYDGGLELVTDLKTPVGSERIDITSKLTIFQALVYSEADKVKNLSGGDYWKAPDINLENIFTAGITKYLMVNLYTQLLYDKQISKGGRFKQTLSLGLTFKFI